MTWRATSARACLDKIEWTGGRRRAAARPTARAAAGGVGGYGGVARACEAPEHRAAVASCGGRTVLCARRALRG